MLASGIQQHGGTDNIARDEVCRREDTAIDVTFGREIDQANVAMRGQNFLHPLGIGDIGPNKLVSISKALGQISGGLQGTCVRQKVDIGNAFRVVMFQNVADKIASDEAATARY